MDKIEENLLPENHVDEVLSNYLDRFKFNKKILSYDKDDEDDDK